LATTAVTAAYDTAAAAAVVAAVVSQQQWFHNIPIFLCKLRMAEKLLQSLKAYKNYQVL
jgi:hypothetical protein